MIELAKGCDGFLRNEKLTKDKFQEGSGYEVQASYMVHSEEG